MNDLERLIAEMTVADLAKLSGRTPAEIAAYALSGPARSTTANPARAARPSARTPRNGKASDAGAGDLAAKILAVLGAAATPLRSMDLESSVGGTTEARRAALHRLIEDKKIRKSGVARGTRYALR